MVLPILAIAGSALALRAMRPRQMSLFGGSATNGKTRKKSRKSHAQTASKKRRKRLAPPPPPPLTPTELRSDQDRCLNDLGAPRRRVTRRKRHYAKASSSTPRKRSKAELHALRLANLAKARAARKKHGKHRSYKRLPPKALCRKPDGRIKKKAPKKVCRTSSGRFRKNR